MSRKDGSNYFSAVESAHGQNGESAQPDAALGLFIKDACAKAGENRPQPTLAPSLAQNETGQGGEEKLQVPGSLREQLPELPPAARPLRQGRPPVLTPKIKEQLCMLLTLGLSKRQAAAYLDIDQSTISKAAERDAEFAHGLARAEDLRVTHPLLHIVAESRRNWRAAAWLVKNAPKIKEKPSLEDRRSKHLERLETIRRDAEAQQLRDAMQEERAIATRQREQERNRVTAARMRELERQEKAEREARRAKRLALQQGLEAG